MNVHTIRSKANQIWKDLQRDRIIVNGEEVSGELGAERMLGALVRHLAEKADWIKAKQDKLNSRKSRLCPMELSTTALSHSQQPQHNPFAMEFAVSEAQIVECAKDLLVLCNRTQSGGDTYFCIEALLSGEHLKDLCILTPYSAEAEPLQFKIDIVEISQHLSSQQRKRSNTTPATLPEFMTTSSSAQKVKLLQQLLASSSSHIDGNEAEDEGEAMIRLQEADALTTPPAMRSLPPLPAATNPSSRRINASTKRSFTFQEIENDLLVQQQQSQLQQLTLDHRPIRSSSLASNGSAPSSSNNDGMSSTPSVPLSSSVTGNRRPQLDLKRDLEIENLLGGSVWTSSKVGMVTTPVHSSANQSPAMSSHPSRPSLAGSDEKREKAHHGFHVANSQDISVDSQQETAVVFRDHPQHHYSDQQLTEGLDFHQSQRQQAMRGDDFSVISELTFDTYLKHQHSRKNNSNGRPNSQDSNKDPLTSGEEEDGNILGGHDNLHEDEVIIDHVQSKSAKHKSLLKRIGHKLKPFKMPNMHLAEGFEGMKSPFRPKRATTDPLTYGTAAVNNQHIATSYSNEVISSSGVHSGAGSSNGGGNASQQSTHKEPFHGIFISHISPRPMFTARNGDVHHNEPIHQSPSSAHPTNHNGDHHEEAVQQPRLALRVQVRAFSQYRICSANPTGIESIDSWATVAGTFYQSFLLVGDGKGQLGMADRLVTIEVDGC